MPEPPPRGASGMDGDPQPGVGGGPVLGLLARGLELWLRQQCEAIEELQIDLEGHAVQLLQGRLAGVRLQARGVVFQQLELERVVLRSEPIQVRMGALLRNRGLQLERPFQIRGWVSFRAEGLNRSLAKPPWSDLGDALAEELLGLAPLGGLRIEGEQLILRSLAISEGQWLERPTRLLADGGGLVLEGDPAGLELQPKRVLLPRDDNIVVQRVDVGGGMLELHGRALVNP